jgi:hypothetical protein
MAVPFVLIQKEPKNQVIPIAATAQARLPAAWAYRSPLLFDCSLLPKFWLAPKIASKKASGEMQQNKLALREGEALATFC